MENTNKPALTSEESYDGFFFLWRKITRSWVWELDLEEFKIVILCLIKANHTGKEWFDGSKFVQIKRGSFITSREHFAQEVRSGINSSKVYRTWKKLKKPRFLDIKANNQYSLISILNYEKYQSLVNSKTHSDRTASEQRPNTTNNDNNEKNDKKVIDKSITTPVSGRELSERRTGRPRPEVNFVLEEFSRIFQLAKPADQRPRQWAYHISRKLSPPSITQLFEWAYSQEWGKKVTKLESLFRQIPMFERQKGGVYAPDAKFDNPDWI